MFKTKFCIEKKCIQNMYVVIVFQFILSEEKKHPVYTYNVHTICCRDKHCFNLYFWRKKKTPCLYIQCSYNMLSRQIFATKKVGNLP